MPKRAPGLIIEQTTDRRAAFDGAGFVVNATAIDRNRLWKLDWEVPRKYGIRHTLGENGGPGGLMFTLRTLPLVFDFVREMQELCPQALFINFSNPESRIILALGKYSPIRALGLCHGIFMGRNDVAQHHGPAGGAGRRLGRGPQSFPMSAANPPSGDRRRPLSAAARQGEGLRPLLHAAHPPAVPRLRLLDDLQRRSSSANILPMAGKAASTATTSTPTNAGARNSAMRSIACSPARRCRRIG